MSSKVRSLEKARERQKAKDGVITVTLEQLIESAGAASQLLSKSIPIRTAFQLSKIAKASNVELEQYNASQNTLSERYANKDEDGKAIRLAVDGGPYVEGQSFRYDIPADKLEGFGKEMKELQSIEVEIPGQQIKVSELGDISIEPGLLMKLEWLITD